MDFWDLTRLLARRWYLALPMLVLTAAGTVWTLVGIAPNYIATAYVQMVPPVTQPTLPGQQSADQRNPWITLGPYTLANAVIVTVQDDAFVEELIDAGYSDTFTATLASGSPLITIEVTGSSQGQAAGTANAIVDKITQNVKELQSSYAALPGDYITVHRLDLGTNIKPSTAKVKRALVAVLGGGLLFTIAWTVGVDAILRRRARVRAGLPPAEPTPASLLPERPLGPSGAPGPRYEPRPSAPRTIRTEPSPARAHPDIARPGGIGIGNGSGSAAWPGNGAAAPAPIATTYPIAATVPITVDDHDSDDDEDLDAVEPEPAEDEAAAPVLSDGTIAVMQPDSTVVLPLSYKSWRQRDTLGN